ncbi:MAG: tetratricopeptide repeat protein [Myxococcota bacterium]|nr:tetratricopeptide repeat protein [Myxococcota bacterium]
MKFLCCLAVFAFWFGVAHGQTPEPKAGESAAMRHLDMGEYSSARRIAEKELQRTSNQSIWANYVLGVCHSEGEGNLARGLFLVRRAKAQLIDKFSRSPVQDVVRRWHRRILMREQFVLAQLDRREEQLDILTEYDDEYKGEKSYYRIWPLLKLGRFEEARRIAHANRTSDKAYIRERAFNGLMAIEEEAGNREASYTWGLRGLEDTRSQSCIIATNLALGARRTFRFAKTIEHDQTALRAKDKSCPTSPNAQLAAMYLVFGEFQQSLSALKALRMAPRTPDMKVQNEMVIRARFVELLHALGAFEQAAVRAQEIIDEPDRAGMVSTAAETIELTNQILAWSVLNARQEQFRERASARPFFDALSERKEQFKLVRTKRSVARQAIRLASIPGNLEKVIRPYMTDLMPWFGADIVQVLGHGVMDRIIEEARVKETDFKDTASAFLDAYIGEMAWRDGRYIDAIKSGQSLLKRIPKTTKLLRLRIRTWLADALVQTGQTSAANDHFHRILETYPTALRHLRVRLPATLSFSGSRGEEIADRLQDSPRLRIDDNASFRVRVEDRGKTIEICVEGTKKYGCGTLALDTLEPEDEPVSAAIDAFHNDGFSPKIEMTQSDISSLDGRAIRSDAKQAIDSLIGRPRRARRVKDKP